MANVKTLTEVEALALALHGTMVADQRFGKEQAEKAQAKIRELFKSGKLADLDFDRASARLGNHSAVRQWGEKMGFCRKTDAERDALARQIDEMVKGGKAAIDKMIG
jgi:tyrosyl-tRNA synthetase